MLYLDETNGLGLDADGYLWARFLSVPDVCLGPIEDEPWVPAPMEGERDELLEAWTGPSRRDELAEWRSTYRRQSGVFRGL